MIEPVVIIGGGMASIRLAERLRAAGMRDPLVIVSRETAMPYNRVLLSEVLADRLPTDGIALHEAEWFEAQDVKLLTGSVVSEIDTESCQLRLEDGITLGYSKLVLATGSVGVVPDSCLPLPAHAVTFRSLEDCEAIAGRLGAGKKVVVLGGGLLGVEAATAIAARGAMVTLIHRGRWIMNRQLDEGAARVLAHQLKDKGVEVCLQVDVAGLAEDVRLSDGSSLEADLVVLATGIVPETTLARDAGIEVRRGVLVDHNFSTSSKGVYAVGECCEVNGETAGLLAPIWEQVGRLVAHLVHGTHFDSFEVPPHVVRLKVSGIDVHVMGVADSDETVQFEDRAAGVYRKLSLRGGKLVGATLVGDLRHSAEYLEMIGSGLDRLDPVALQFTGTSSQLSME